MKKVAIVLGLLLLIAGVLVSAGAVSYPDQQELLSVGDASVSVETQKRPTPTLGYVLLGVGGLITAVGFVLPRR